MNMHTVRESAASPPGPTSRSPVRSFQGRPQGCACLPACLRARRAVGTASQTELAHMLSSESLPGDVMDPKSYSFPCSAANGRREPKQPSSSPERGDARPKPPVKPKPCVLPKPAVPVKPVPGLRQTLSEVPSAEKINLLAGPKPYSSGAGSSVKRLSFSLKSPPKEATNGKEVLSPFSTMVKPCGEDGEAAGPAREPAAMEGTSGRECGESCTVRKSTAPFKVKPVLVAAKPERFPGTTVEEILAKIEKPNKEGPNSPERPRLVRSFFSQDGGTAVHLGPKGYTTFQRNASEGEQGGAESEDPVYKVSCEVEERRLSRNKEETTNSNGQHVPEPEQPARATERNLDFLSRDSSSRPSMSCDGGQLGNSSPSSHPGTYQPLSEFSSGFTPGSPSAAAEAAQAPGSPYIPAAVSSIKAQFPPGSPDAPLEPLRSPVCSSLSVTQSPGSPPALPDPLPPECPSISIKTLTGHPIISGISDLTRRDPDVSLLPRQSASFTHAHGDHGPAPQQNLLQMSESPGSPSTSEYHVGSDQPPGSPTNKQVPSVLSGDHELLRNQVQMPFLNEDPQLSKLGLRRASEGVVQPQHKNTVREELGGSLAVLPSGGGHPFSSGGESNWSLSQSFEWSFSNQPVELGERRLGSPPQSPIQEAEDTVLLETELGVENLRHKGASEETGSQEQNRRGEEDEPEALGCSSCLCDSSDSQTNGKKSEGQLESPSALSISGPGGPSVQKEPASLELTTPIVAAEVGFQEEGDSFLPFPPTHEEGALQIMEPLSSVETAAPPAEPCILFSEHAQVQTAASCQEDDDALGLAQEGKAGDTDLKGAEPHPGSHWLDKLLASPPPSADDVKRRGLPKLEHPIGPEDLLGWSRKDLCSEFGIVEVNRSAAFDVDWAPDISKVDWPGETEQDREFGPGTQDWSTSYNIGDTQRQDVEFGASQQDWTKGTPLLGGSSPKQEEWLTAYSSSCSDQQMKESDWSSTYSISTTEHQGEPYVRKPGWPQLCTDVDDEGNSKHSTEKTGWSKQYNVDALEKISWPNKCNVEISSCPEPEVNTSSSAESSKYPTDNLQGTKLNIGHSEGSDDAIEVISHNDPVSGSESVWPSESIAGCRAKQLQTELYASQLKQPTEYSSNTLESQGSIQQQPRPNTYGLDDSCSQDHIWSVKQSDWPSKYDLGVAQTSDGSFSAEKTDASSEHDDGQACWEKELSDIKKGNTTTSETGDLEFCTQSPVWADDYSLRKTCPQGSDFSAGTRDWVKDTDASRIEQKELFGATQKDRDGVFRTVDFPGQRLMVDLGATIDSQMDLSETLRTVGETEFRGVGEGQHECTPSLGFRHIDLETGCPDTSTESTEKEHQWFPSMDLEASSASPEAEETREPGVGQADFCYPFGTETMDLFNLRPKALNMTEEVGPVQMDCSDATLVECEDYSCHLKATGLGSDVMQHSETSGGSVDRKFHSQRLSSPSRLLEEMVSKSAVEEVVQQKRPISFPSCQSEGEKGLSSFPDLQVPSDEKARGSPSPMVDKEKVLSDVDGGSHRLDSGNESESYLETKALCHVEKNGSQGMQTVSQEDQTSDGAETLATENFIFLEDTEVLDNTVYRDRANLGRKRGHRAPATRSGGAVSESDRNSWMFRDSTEPRRASAASDEEVQEEPKSRKSRSSPLSKGVKGPLFPGLSPSALKAKLRGRNRSAEEGDPQSEAKDAQVQRSKSCKIGGKPLVLPPKPEKTAGSETSSPNWLQVLKLKKKKP
uniref:182 kDa tankyrase-1-binding protein isoform X2 n=1 Tax=Pogona vitticeps TaxID=103695 RepID=A0A6J0TLB3_9SAUR